MKKYFITNDLENTVKPFGSIGEGDLITIREGIKETLSISYPGCIEQKPYQEIQQYLDTCDPNIISLDDIYYSGPNSISITRVYDSINAIQKNTYTNKSREGANINFSNIVANKSNTIIDDGIFSGDTIKSIMEGLPPQTIKKVKVGFNFSEDNNIAGASIESLYPDTECIDRIDERDFFYGIKNAGASIQYQNTIGGVPYVFNNSILQQKASIPSRNTEKTRKAFIEINNILRECLGNPKLKDIERLCFMQEIYNKETKILDILNNEKK